ncbi:MAG TPA: NCS2 family permease [Thermoanaerobaculia bacterium]|nr:NCS2 family permease [Thermoanaerobaculia bacterium]
MLDRFFRLSARGTTVATELRAGLVTFLTMSYILFVNPQILGAAGMPVADVAVATALAAAIGTAVMALLADLPIALAPGMGLNAYFTYGVVIGMGVPWEMALAAVFVEGLLFLLLVAVGAREALVRAIPLPIKVATMCGIGLFLAIIGLEGAGLVVAHPATLVTLGDLTAPAPLLAAAGVVLIGVLLARRIQGAIFLGIAAVTAAAWAFGLAPGPEAVLSLPRLPEETFLALDFSAILTLGFLPIVAAFLFVDFFDTAGTLLGVGRLAGLTDEEGNLPRAGRAFTADAVGTTAGALLGTSTVTSYVESGTGIEEGGRTGLTALTVSFLFLLALFVTPLLAAVPVAATAPALVVVGAMMMAGARDLDWSLPADALPAFVTIVAMPFTYSIANGIAFGILTWVAIRLAAGRWREIHPLMAGLAVVLAIYYALA